MSPLDVLSRASIYLLTRPFLKKGENRGNMNRYEHLNQALWEHDLPRGGSVVDPADLRTCVDFGTVR